MNFSSRYPDSHRTGRGSTTQKVHTDRLVCTPYLLHGAESFFRS